MQAICLQRQRRRRQYRDKYTRFVQRRRVRGASAHKKVKLSIPFFWQMIL